MRDFIQSDHTGGQGIKFKASGRSRAKSNDKGTFSRQEIVTVPRRQVKNEYVHVFYPWIHGKQGGA